MKLLKSTLLIALFAFMGAFALTAIDASTAVAHDGEDHSDEAEHSDDESSNENETKTYTYTAQPGDSYSVIARKSIQTYGYDKNVNLSQAQIIAAETYLTQGAESPILNLGQEVSISESDISSAIDKAEDLSDEQEAAWNQYAMYADFNTDNVGESS